MVRPISAQESVPEQSEKLRTILEKVRQLGPTLRERALAAERAGRLSDETIADLDAAGAFNIGSPAEFGGDALSDWHEVDGVRGTGSVSIKLAGDELFVPDYRGVDFQDILRGSLDNGLKGSLWKAPSLGWAFSLMAGMSIGIAQGALERFLERSAGRPIRGTTYKNQLEAPLTHLMLSEVHSKIQSATLMARANADETDQLGVLAAAGTPADPKYLQLFGARVLVETAYAARWCAEAIELLQRNSGSTAIMDFEPT